MRVDCYNACETVLEEIEYGDTFYYLGKLYMRVSFDIGELERSVVVDLAKGEAIFMPNNTQVILADTKVVANTKDTF